MGIIKKQVKVAGSKSERDCEVLFDSGASACFVREDIASGLGGIVTLPSPISFRLGNNTVMKADRTSVFLLDLNGHKLSFYFLVVAELPYEVIVGANFFQNWKIKLDPITEDFIIDEKALEIMLVVLSKEVKPGEVESRRENPCHSDFDFLSIEGEDGKKEAHPTLPLIWQGARSARL